MTITFTKSKALGNDFVLVEDSGAQITRLSPVLPATVIWNRLRWRAGSHTDSRAVGMIMYNPDGPRPKPAGTVCDAWQVYLDRGK